MNGQDLFVGAIAILLGALSAAGGALNWEWMFRLGKARWVESRWGRKQARFFCILLGAILIILGGAIMAGFGPFAGIDPQ